MSDADVRQALYAAFNELEKDVVNLILDESPDIGAATAQLKQLQPKHRPIVLPSSLVKKPKKAAAPASPQPKQQPRAPVLPPPDPSRPFRGWWPKAEGVALGDELSEKERGVLTFVCDMFPSVELGTASALLKESGGDVEATVGLIAAMEAVPPPGNPMRLDELSGAASPMPIPSRAFGGIAEEEDKDDEGEEPVMEASDTRRDKGPQEAFPALVRAPTGVPHTKQANRATKKLQELFPLLPRSTLCAALDKHSWNAEAAADELLLSGEEEQTQPDDKKRKSGSGVQKRLTWTEVSKLVKCPPPRPWGQLFLPSNPLPPPPPSFYSLPTPPAAAAPASLAVPSLAKSDLSTQLKWRMLKQRVPWVDEEVLESVWVFSSYSLLRTLHALASLYPEPFSYDLLPPLSSSSPSVISLSPSLSPSTPHPSPVPAAAPHPTPAAAPLRTVAVPAAPPQASVSAQAAKDMAHRRHLLCHAAAQAFVAGNGARAKQLAAEAREASEALKSAHEVRWRAAHSAATRRGAPLLEVDLHGLTVDDALDVVARVIGHMRQALQEDPGRPRMLSLITGVGKHSAGGVARIRPALLAYLKHEGVPYNEARTGNVVVRIV